MPAADGNATKKAPKAQPKSYFKKTVSYNLGFRKPKPQGIAHDAPMTKRDKQVVAQRLDPSKVAPHLFHDVAPTQAERRTASINAYKLLTPGQRLAFRRKYLPHPSVSKSTLENLVDPSHLVRMYAKGGQSLAAVGVAAYHDPIGVPKKTVEGGAKMLFAAPLGIVHAVEHPEKTLKAMVADETHRHGQSFAAKVKRIRKEGAAPEVADALTVASVGGATLGRGLGQLGRARGWAHLVEPRPALRTVTEVRPQELSKNYFTAVGQRGKDALRTRRTRLKGTDALAGGKETDVATAEAHRVNQAAGKVVEVAKKERPRTLRGLVQRGPAIYGLKHDQGKRTAVATKEINKLNADEKRAFYYATVFGIRTPAQATHVLTALQKKIVATRARTPIQITGSLKKSDMLPDIAAMLADPAAHFTPKLGDTVEALRSDSMRAGREDPRLSSAAQRIERRYAPIRDVFGLHRGEEFVPTPAGQVPPLHYANETDAAYLKRLVDHVHKPAADGGLGLAKPLYFRSDRYHHLSDFAPRTLGGKRAIAIDRKYKGENLAAGLQDTRPSMYINGLARNIKAKHNWNFVADLLDRTRIKELSPPKGTTVSRILDTVAKHGIDPTTVELWNPGVLRDLAKKKTAANGAEHLAASEEFAQEHIASAVQQSTMRINHAGQLTDAKGNLIPESEFKAASGWHAVPTPVMRELEAQMTPSTVVERSWAVGKGKASRFILGANLPWLTYQVANNAAVGAVASHGGVLNPANWVHARQWMHSLSPDEQGKLGGKYGLDVTAADSHQVRLGASTNNDFVNFYRGFKAHPFWHTGIAHGHGPSISDLNPLEAGFRADRAQNNAFRTTVAYSLAKREAVSRMGASMGHADRAQLKIMHAFKKPPADMLHDLATDPAVLEEHARAVTKWMGDYTNMLAGERRGLNQLVMFYPYMRYSLRLVFWTLPVHHPIVTALGAQLGNLESKELEKLFGNRWTRQAGKIYVSAGRSIDLARANPALNALVDAVSNRSAGQLLGIAPPFVVEAVNQLAQKDMYSGKDWAVHGKAAPYGGNPLSVLDPDRLRIAANDALKLTFGYRTAVKLTQPGPQGVDSLLLSPRPTVFKGNTAVSKLQRKFGKERQAFYAKNDDLLHELIPFLPHADRSAKDAAEAAIVDRASAPAKKHRTGGPHYDIGGGGSGSGPHYDIGGS